MFRFIIVQCSCLSIADKFESWFYFILLLHINFTPVNLLHQAFYAFFDTLWQILLLFFKLRVFSGCLAHRLFDSSTLEQIFISHFFGCHSQTTSTCIEWVSESNKQMAPVLYVISFVIAVIVTWLFHNINKATGGAGVPVIGIYLDQYAPHLNFVDADEVKKVLCPFLYFFKSIKIHCRAKTRRERPAKGKESTSTKTSVCFWLKFVYEGPLGLWINCYFFYEFRNLNLGIFYYESIFSLFNYVYIAW